MAKVSPAAGCSLVAAGVAALLDALSLLVAARDDAGHGALETPVEANSDGTDAAADQPGTAVPRK